MAKITTREELVEYIRRRLGAPCIKTSDLHDLQIDDIIDFALDRFYEQAIGIAQEERILYLPVQQGVGYVDISDVEPTVTAVNEVLSDYNSDIWSNLNTLFTVENMMLHRWGFNIYQPDVITFQIMYEWLDLFKTMYGRQYRVEIDEFGGIARVLPFPRHDGGIFIDVWVKRPEAQLYRHSWIRDYVFAKCMIQIGMNRGKYSGVTLPGGGTLNADMYLNKGEQMVEKLEEALLTEWSEPPDFFVA